MTDFPHASVVDGVRFTAQVGLPNVVQGLFKKRELPSRIAGLAKAEMLAYQLVEGLVRRLGPGPFYVRVGTEEALLVHQPRDLEFVLGGSPEPFASDPETKRKGMTAFQPDALTISRGSLWRNRRDFTEAVLQTGSPVHTLAPRFLEVVAHAVDELAGYETVEWEDLNDAFQRITRTVVFGEVAAADRDLTKELDECMAAGNSTPGRPADAYPSLLAHIQRYVDSPDPQSLTGLFAQAPHDARTNPAGQVIHWLFAMGDTLPLNLMRALALLATHPEPLREVRAEIDAADLADPVAVTELAYLGGSIDEAMRLWPTTPLFGRVATEDVTFPGGQLLPAGKQVLIHNLFNHRNRALVPYADRFSPGEWASGDAGTSWLFNFFSHGPQGCPGAGLALFLGQAFLAYLLRNWTPSLNGASLDPRRRLPYGLDVFGISIGLSPRE